MRVTTLYISDMAIVRKDVRDVRFRHAVRTKLGGITQAGTLVDSWGYRPADPERNLRVMNCYQTVYLFEGSGRFFDATGCSLPVRAGDLILTFPQLGHSYGPGPDERWSEFYIQFQGPVFDLWKGDGLINPAQPIAHLEPVDLWLRRFKSVLGDEREPGIPLALLETCRLQLVLAEALLGTSKLDHPSEEKAWLSKAGALLDAYPARDLDLRGLARQMGTSEEGFRKRFTRLAGVPPGKYRTTHIVDRACELLLEGHLTNRQIADKLGFSDEFHFSRRIKEVTGMTPSEFRRRLPRGDQP